MSIPIGYQKPTTMHDNDYITDPSVPDPDNLPQPLGWSILVRPYPIESITKGGIILNTNEAEYVRNSTNIARVVAIGPCSWNRSQHKDKEGNQFNWAEVGDFIAYPRHVGKMRNFKGVTYVILNDDDIIERLSDPMVFTDEDLYQLMIPEEELEKGNTIYNPKFKG